MALQRVTEPTTEPVTVAQVKQQLSIQTDDTLIDDVIERRITEARQWAENYMGRTIMPCQWRVVLDRFPSELMLHMPTVTSIDAVTYIDTAQVSQTLDPLSYYLDSVSTPNWLLPAYGESWPDTLNTANAVSVLYTAGYEDADSVPGPIKEAIMLVVGHWTRFQPSIENGLSITRIPYAVECLLTNYRVFSFG